MITNLIASKEASPDIAVIEVPSNRLPEAAGSIVEPAPIAAYTEPSTRALKDMVNLFKLLADETRLRIMLYLIQRGELNVRALCDRLHQSQPAVSHHLALLRMAGIVECRRAGKHNIYHVLPERFQSFLDTLFQNVPAPDRQICFTDYILKQLGRD